MKRVFYLIPVLAMIIAVSFTLAWHSTLTDTDYLGSTEPSSEVSDHAYVVMGEIDGKALKWATCNVGASIPEEFGDYFAWGEIKPMSDNPRPNTVKFTKYAKDKKTVLESVDDAAAANWGGTWRMPTDEEWTWLRNNCTWTWTKDYNETGVVGMIVVSNVPGYEGNQLFFPASGRWNEAGLAFYNIYGYYWSSSLHTGNSNCAWYSIFSGSFLRNYVSRFYGQSVRPVSE